MGRFRKDLPNHARHHNYQNHQHHDNILMSIGEWWWISLLFGRGRRIQLQGKQQPLTGGEMVMMMIKLLMLIIKYKASKWICAKKALEKKTIWELSGEEMVKMIIINIWSNQISVKIYLNKRRLSKSCGISWVLNVPVHGVEGFIFLFDSLPKKSRF